MNVLNPTSVENSELVEQTFHFWFTDSEHIRSPFPEYIRTELKNKSIARFQEWVGKLTDKAKDDINDTIIGEKFEEIIFENALELVITEDEKITISYPFLPRLGDEIKERSDSTEKSTIVDRLIEKEGDTVFLKVKCEREESKNKWETKFELPL